MTKAFLVERYSWCKKYEHPIDVDLENICPFWGNPDFKGCAGEKCPHLTIKVFTEER